MDEFNEFKNSVHGVNHGGAKGHVEDSLTRQTQVHDQGMPQRGVSSA